MTRYSDWYGNRPRGEWKQRVGEEADAGPVIRVAEREDLRFRDARLRWAELLRRIYEVDPLGCPQCGGGHADCGLPPRARRDRRDSRARTSGRGGAGGRARAPFDAGPDAATQRVRVGRARVAVRPEPLGTAGHHVCAALPGRGLGHGPPPGARPDAAPTRPGGHPRSPHRRPFRGVRPRRDDWAGSPRWFSGPVPVTDPGFRFSRAASYQLSVPLPCDRPPPAWP